jgi:hypothetical protein
MRFVCLTAAFLSAVLVGSAAADAPKGKAGLDLLDTLAIKQGMDAVSDAIGASIPLASGEGYDVYQFRSAGVTVKRGAPHYDRIGARYSAGNAPGKVCFDFGSKAKKFCGKVTFGGTRFTIAADDGRVLTGDAVYEKPTRTGQLKKMEPKIAKTVRFQEECSCFREIFATGKSGSFLSLKEEAEEGADPNWYEKDEPFFNVTLDNDAFPLKCLVNEGGNMVFCQVDDLVDASPEKENAHAAAWVAKVGKCFGAKAVPSRVKDDGLRQDGMEFALGGNVTAYALKGARQPLLKDHHKQLYLVTFYIGAK